MTYREGERPFPRAPLPAPVPQDEFADEAPQEQPQESKPGWEWIGDDRRPEAKEHSDGISDLFAAPDQQEIDDDMHDLTDVAVEADIIDGPLDDLVDVRESDIMGDDEDVDEQVDAFNRPPQRPQSRPTPRGRFIRRPTPPTSLGGLR